MSGPRSKSPKYEPKLDSIPANIPRTGVTVKSVRVNIGPPGGPFLLADLVPSRRIRPPLQSVQLTN